MNGSASLVVKQVPTAVAVSPPEIAFSALADTIRLLGTATDRNGHDIASPEVEWMSSDSAVAVVDGNGLATAVGNGVAEVTLAAESLVGAVSATAGVSVAQIAETVTLSASALMFASLGDTTRLVAAAADRNGFEVANPNLLWASSAPAVATTDQSGLVKGIGNGEAEITATAESGTGTAAGAAVTVRQVATTLTITPTTLAFSSLGDTLRLVVAATDGNNHPILDPAVNWVSADSTVAVVSQSGLVTATGNGTAMITATAGPAGRPVVATALVSVEQIPVSVEVSPRGATLAAIGDTIRLTGVVVDGNGHPVPGSATVSWVSSSPAVATVDDGGLVTPPNLPQASGPYRLSGRDANGTALFSLDFDMDPVADGGQAKGFVFSVPVCGFRSAGASPALRRGGGSESGHPDDRMWTLTPSIESTMKRFTMRPPARATLSLAFPSLVLVLAAAAPWQPLAAQHGDGMYAGATVLRAARLLDVETGEMHTDAVIVVEDGVITAVNPGTVPDAMHDMDLGDVTLLPGFIDAHTHLAMEISAASFTDAVMRTEAYGAYNAVKFGGRTVRAGFTTVRDFGGDVTVELGHAVERGDIVAPRVIPSRNSLGITGGHCDVTGFSPGILEGGPEEGVADGPWEVVEAVRYQIKHGARVIKTCATAGVLSMEGPVGAQQYTLEELTAMVEEAARHGIPVAAHAHGSEGIMAAVRAGVASIEHGSILTDEIMDLMIERGTYLVPTTYLVDRIALDQLPALVRRKAEEILPHARNSVQRAIERGVPIAFGTDAGVFPHGENAGEFVVYVQMGMSELAALRTATIHAAELLGTPDRGRLAEGMLADVIAVPGNPLDDIEVTKDVRFVMLGGRVIKHVIGGRDMHSTGH